jgi:RHS repeat-associated protein
MNNGAGGTPNTSWIDAFYLSPTPSYQAGTAIPLLPTQMYAGSLNAGASYTNTVTATVPNGVSGSYYLIVDTDSASAVWELPSNVGDRFGSSTSTIQIASRPADLVVSAASAPASGTAGGGVFVTWTVLNQGAGDTILASWQDSVYVSSSPTLPVGTAPVASFAHTGLLNSGVSYTQTQLLTLPIGLATGTYYVFVQTNTATDPTDSVYESDGTNNLSAGSQIAITQQLADLQVTSVNPVAAASKGGSVTVQWAVQNTGAGTTNSNYWNDDVWVSTNPTLGSGGTDVYLGTAQHTNPLAAGASYNASLSVTVPPALATGNYYFIVATDRPVQPPGSSRWANLVFESNESNNQLGESAATNVTQGPTADLTVSNVSAPTPAIGGGLLSVSWTVTNKGTANVTVPIQDAVYLSYYPGLDPSARYLGTVSQTGGLASGASYSQNASLQLPAGLAGTFYVFVVSDSDGSIFELNPSHSTQHGPTPVQIQLPPPADLVAGTVTLPANPVPNQPITITYQVTNNGTNAANGSWYDSLYLSPTPTWSVNDPVLGQVHQVQNLASGASYMGTLTAPLPALTPGSYYVIVRSNILDTLPEVTLSNNLSASVTEASIDAQPLPLNQPTTATLQKGQSAFYKVDVAAGQTLRIALQGDPAFKNQLFLRYGTMPTAGQYDYRYQTAGPSQQITVPTTQAGTYYILVSGTSASVSTENYTLSAALVPFSINGVQAGTVGAGPATIEIDGAKFDNGTTFQLLGPSHTVVQAQQVTLQDASTAFVKFDLTNAPLGTYDVQATHADRTTTQLTGALTVVAAVPANLRVYLSMPSGVLPGSQGEVSVNFVNTGNIDLVAPLLQLSATNAQIRLSTQTAFGSGPVWFLGTSDTGPAGVLRPGESGAISLPFQTTGPVGQSVHFNVQIADDSQAMDWTGQKSSLRLPTISAAAWDGVFSNFVANVGTTVASYHAALAADATYLGQLGQPTYDVLQLLCFEIEKANAAYTTQTLATVTDDSLPAQGLALTFQRSFQQSIGGRYTTGILGYGWSTNSDISASTDAQGNAAIHDNGIALYYVKQTDGSYLPEPGDYSVLTFANGAYRLVQKDGTVYQFNANGELAYVQDADGDRIATGYNTAGQLVSLTDSNGESLTLTYNAQGHLAQLTDSNGLSETYGYDATGNYLTTYTDRYGTTTYSYVTGQAPAQNNALAQIAFADNTHVFFGYDSQGRLIDQHRDGGAEDVTFSYLSPGGYVRTDAVGDKTTILFDRFGATAETIDPLGNVTRDQYDGNLNLTEVDGPQDTRTTYQYDANGNLVQETDALGNLQKFTFDANNNLASATDGNGNTTHYAYNGSNDLLSITYADGSQQQYTYNPLGEATQYLNARGQAIGYTYNSQGLVIQETFANQTSYAFTYDNRGNLLTATDASGNVTLFSYTDPRNPDFLTKVAYPDGTSLRFTYNVVGQRTQSVDQSGFTVNYSYDSVGRLSKLTDGTGKLIVGYTYDAAGRLAQKDMGNGTRTTYSYDAGGNVLRITNLAADHATVNSFDTYTYDALGHVLTDASQDGKWTYSYDADGQLTGAVFASSNTNVLPNESIQYAYDAAGNRITQTVNGVETSYVVNNLNEYTSSTTTGVGTTTYQYDADGNLVTKTDPNNNQTRYTFDVLNELTAVVGPGISTSYGYDTLGHRVSQTVNGTTTTFQIDPTGLGNVVAAFGSGGLVAHYTYGLGLVSQVDAAGRSAFYDFNRTGDTIGITNTLGHYASRYAYLPFGQTTKIAAGLPSSFTYRGQAGALTEADGTVFMEPRNYDPSTGRFLSRDPHGVPAGKTNVRLSVGDDPTGPCKDWVEQQRQNIQKTLDGPAAHIHSGPGNALSGADLDGAAFPCECPPTAPPTVPSKPGPSGGPDINIPLDPNYMTGPLGFGTPNYISANQQLPYAVFFENEPTAGFPAQQVVVTQQLDPNLNWASFRLGAFGFGGKLYSVPTNVASYQMRIDLTATRGFYVDVTANIDVSTGIATWTFTTIDPATGQKPADPTIGFLPPDLFRGSGAGFVSYHILPVKTITTGTVILAQATVLFDNQPPIDTAPFFNTIDTSYGLSSSVNPLPAFQASPTFQVSWSGTDSNLGSAVGNYTINVSDNGGAYTPWLSNTSLTQAMYTGLPGHTYRFYSVATDNTGNAQAVLGAVQSTAVVADHLVLQAPTQTIGGGMFTVTAQAINPDGILDTHYNGSVALTMSTGPANGILSGVTIVPVQNGIATFTNLALSAPGGYTLVAASTTDLLGASATIVVAPTTQFTVHAAAATAGNAVTITVTAMDANNKTDRSYLGTVLFSSSDVRAGLPASYTFQPGDQGTKTLSVTLETAGKQSVTVTDTTQPVAKGVGTVTVAPAGAVTFAVAGFPTPDVTGVGHSFTVTAFDAFGNVATGYTGTVHFTSSDPSATLPKDYAFVAADNGAHTFPATLVTTGAQSLTATDKTTSTITGTESGIQVVSAATHLGLTNLPKSATAGQSFTFTVRALTAAGLADSRFADTIHFASSDPNANLPADYTFVPGDKGVKTFTITLETAGTPTIVVTDLTRPGIKGASGKLGVAPAAAVSMSMGGFSAPAVSGAPQPLTVTLLDAYGNRAASVAGMTLIFSSSDPHAQFPPAYTFKAADNGAHTFPVTFMTAGSQWLTAADKANSVLPVTQSGIQVLSPATHLAVSTLPTGGATAGQAFNVTVTADTGTNLADGQFVDTIHFASSDPRAVLPADYTFTAADKGARSFPLTLGTTGAETVTVTDITRPAIKGASGQLSVAPAAAASLNASGFPTPAVSGVMSSFTVTALDAFGNRATGYTGTVHFTSSDPSATLPKDYTFTAADKGSHTFPAKLAELGIQSLIATDKANITISGSESGIQVVSPATHLVLGGLPGTVTAGRSVTIMVTAQNASNLNDPLFGDTVHFSSSDPAAVLPADYSFAPGDQGSKTFTVTFQTAGKATLTVTDGLRSSVKGATAATLVNPGPAASLRVTGFQTLTLAGDPHGVTVTALDAFGNVTTGYTGTVHLASSDANATLPPTDYTFSAADRGVHTFPVTLQTLGTQELTAMDTKNGLSGSEGNIAVTQLTVHITGPGVGVPGQPLTFTLAAGESGQPTTTIFTYRIDWFGNGKTFTTVTGPSGTTVSQTYTTSAGFLVKVTAVDAAGNVSLAPILPVSIVPAALETDPANSTQTALFVGGTTGNDTITITPDSSDPTGKTVNVLLNGTRQGTTFQPSGHIVVYGQAGTDTIQEVASSQGVQVAVPAVLFAGMGNTTLSTAGSSATNVLVGGPGNDVLTGGSGRDILIGGAGAATLHAGTGDDILLAGSTAYDGNLPALLSLAQEWGRTDRTYHQRVQDLFGNGTSGYNGTNLLDAQTVAWHTAISQLFGGPGQDWFWLSDSGTVADKIVGYTNGEVESFE